MSKESSIEIIDGKFVDWANLSIEELKKMREEYQKKEKILIDKIDRELEQ